MEKQTAVEWYAQALRKCLMGTVPCDPIQILEQANQMFQEQIMKAYDDGAIDTMQEQEGLDISMDQNGEESERYYKETYNK
jgi:hypothetical protein